MSVLRPKRETAANVCIILLFIATVIGAVGRYVFSPSLPARRDLQISVGEKVNLPGVNWAKNGRTLVLVLSTACPFCTDSASFYRRMVQRAAKEGQVHLVAVFPQSTAEGVKYLDNVAVPIKDVMSATLGSIKVTGTPTLILVNNQGAVTQVWAGRLPGEKETEVFNRL